VRNGNADTLAVSHAAFAARKSARVTGSDQTIGCATTTLFIPFPPETCMSFARSGIAALLALACSSLSVAAPIEYRLQMTFGHDGFETPHPILVGATLDLIYRFDAAALVPLTNNNGGPEVRWFTAWPTTNTSVSATVTGTDASDGTFIGAMDAFTPMEWAFVSDWSSIGNKDQIRFPRIQFPFNGGQVRILDVKADFDDLFINPTSTIYPVAFPVDAPAWGASAKYVTSNPAHRSAMLNVSGFAAIVPEPHSAIALLTGTFGVAALRRRL
jgi:hypothetical protein